MRMIVQPIRQLQLTMVVNIHVICTCVPIVRLLAILYTDVCVSIIIGAVGCHLDRHENIGRGHIGIEGFRRVMCDPRFNNVPMLLETPADSHMDIYRHEIELLHSMCKM